MTITITAFEVSPDQGVGLARDMRVRWALEEVGQPYDVRQRFVDAYWAGDGSNSVNQAGSPFSGATSNSERLVDDLHRLMVYQGLSAAKSRVSERGKSPRWRCGAGLARPGTRRLAPCEDFQPRLAGRASARVARAHGSAVAIPARASSFADRPQQASQLPRI